MMKNICLHGHFYQPPRENYYSGKIPIQPSAAPFENWNVRILHECYKSLCDTPVFIEGKELKRVNNYKYLNFNFGPTLLNWMEKNEPETYRQIIDSDHQSQELFEGHGGAIAQSYHHSILPLLNTRDKMTEIAWGLKDFEHRFGRKAKAIWLPECAIDYDTLELLADFKLEFIILSPSQLAAFRKQGSQTWLGPEKQDFDYNQAYRIPIKKDKSIAAFFYQGDLSQGICFGDYLNDGAKLLQRFEDSLAHRKFGLSHIAVDGETFGHHKRHGEMCIAFLFHLLQQKDDFKVINYSLFLKQNPPVLEAKIKNNSSWSCAHGLGRWTENCGCKIGRGPGWQQHWRAPLRASLEFLKREINELFSSLGKTLLLNPDNCRNHYIEVINQKLSKKDFAKRHFKKDLSSKEVSQAFELLELEKLSLSFFTSCAWFFDEISDIESLQVLHYAACALEKLKDKFNKDAEEKFLNILAKAPSNKKQFLNGRKVFKNLVLAQIKSDQKII